jgi:hypothetical protein
VSRLRPCAAMTAVAVTAGLLVLTTTPASAGDAVLAPVGSPFAQTTYDGRVGSIDQSVVWSAVSFGEVTGDGQVDVVTSGIDGVVRVWSRSGQLQAQADLGRSPIYGSPALGDVSGDGVADVTVGTMNNTIATISFRGGQVTDVLRRTEPARVLPGPTGFFSTPALADLDGDGRLDVIASSYGQTLEAWTAARGVQGARIPGWPQWLFDSIWSSPAVGDVDGDGEVDVVVGGDCEGSGPLQPCWGTRGGGHVWAFNRNGTLKWRHFVPGQTVWSSPALADLNGDGAQDVVVGSGLYWPDPAGRQVLALDGRTGRPLWTAGTPGRVAGSPAVGDVDGDGRPEVFVVTEGGALLSFSATGQRRWQACIDWAGRCPPGIGTHGGAVLADVDGDGQVEVLVRGEDRMRVFDGRTGRLEQTIAQAAPWTVFAPAATATVAQVDGRAHVFQAALGDANRNGRRDTGDALVVLAWRTGQPLGAAPWPTFKGGMERRGALPLPAIDPVQTRAFVSALYLDLLGRPADPAGLQHWTGMIVDRRASRYQVTLALAATDEWIGHNVASFYRSTLRREPDPVGLADWVGRIRRGMPVADVASSFYASQEYYQRVGGQPGAWVGDLYRELLLREPDPGGLDHWTRQLRAGTPRTEVASLFYASQETLHRRIERLYRHLLGRAPDAAGLSSWPPFVRAHGDLALAAALAASAEYHARAQRR